MAEKTNNMGGFGKTVDPLKLKEIERIALKMRQDITRVLIMSDATEQYTEKILRNTKITVTGNDRVERPLEDYP